MTKTAEEKIQDACPHKCKPIHDPPFRYLCIRCGKRLRIKAGVLAIRHEDMEATC